MKPRFGIVTSRVRVRVSRTSLLPFLLHRQQPMVRWSSGTADSVRRLPRRWEGANAPGAGKIEESERERADWSLQAGTGRIDTNQFERNRLRAPLLGECVMLCTRTAPVKKKDSLLRSS